MSTIKDKITPGKWEWKGGNAIWDSTHYLVATTVVYKADLSDNARDVQNAKLIASCPEMLDILERLAVVKETQNHEEDAVAYDLIKQDAIKLLNQLNNE